MEKTNTQMALGEVSGPLNDFFKKLVGEDGEMWLAAFKRFLRRENPWMAATQAFKTWKIVRLGTGLKTADDFHKALKASGFKIGEWANDILDKPAFKAATKESELELVRVTVGEFGFINGATRQQIYQRAQELGLKTCPNEVGPQLRLQYKDQPNGEWIIIAMWPIADSDGNFKLLNVRHNDDGLWLSSNCSSAGYVWNSDNVFIFCK